MPSEPKSALGIVKDGDGYSLNRQGVLGALGGWFGVFEAVVPALVFVTLLSLTKDSVLAVLCAASLSVASLVIQLVRKKPITQAVAGAVGIAISAYLPLRDGGQPADYFVQGFISNTIYLVVLTVSVLVRWPVIGLLVGVLRGVKASEWRKNRSELNRFQLVTLLWVAMFAARLSVQVPLYFTNQIEALGFFRIVMGVPLYALLLWTTWLLVRGTIKQRQ